MIVGFRHKGLERLFTSGSTRGLNAQHAPRLLRLLASLNTATTPENMNLPGYRLHPLKGELAGHWSVSVSGNWRMIFQFRGEDAVNVDLVDYH